MDNKDLRQRALAHTEMAKEVSPNQYSYCKKHKSINSCLNKVLINDILRQKWYCVAIAMNNTQGFFNYIINTVAILILLNFGMSSVAIQALFET